MAGIFHFARSEDGKSHALRNTNPYTVSELHRSSFRGSERAIERSIKDEPSADSCQDDQGPCQHWDQEGAVVTNSKFEACKKHDIPPFVRKKLGQELASRRRDLDNPFLSLDANSGNYTSSGSAKSARTSSRFFESWSLAASSVSALGNIAQTTLGGLACV